MNTSAPVRFDDDEFTSAGWEAAYRVPDVTGGTAVVGVRFARHGELVDTYPAGAHDREVAVRGLPSHGDLRAVADAVLAADPHCRRIVLAVPDGDLDSIGWAEEAGFRYVVSVDTRTSEFALMVLEPYWVFDQPAALEEIPLKE